MKPFVGATNAYAAFARARSTENSALLQFSPNRSFISVRTGGIHLPPFAAACLNDHARTQVSCKSPTGDALKYIAKYWDGLTLFLGDGRIELDNNTVE